MGMVEKLLGFAIKANKIIFGIDNLIRKRQIFLIIISEDVGVSLKKLKIFQKDVPIYSSGIPVGDLVGRPACKAIGITDRQMATAIINNFDSSYLRIFVEEK